MSSSYVYHHIVTPRDATIPGIFWPPATRSSSLPTLKLIAGSRFHPSSGPWPRHSYEEVA